MELKEFIKCTLIDIAEGIRSAQEEGLKFGAIINPQRSKNELNENIKIKDEHYTIQNIEFEVGLTIIEGTEKKSGIGVSLGTIELGKNAKKEGNNTSVNNIKFIVPMVMPSVSNDAIPEKIFFNKEDLGLNVL